ncbi:hypothetical protein AL050_23225 [Pseudomonas syringae pv. daphniphylli]|nr:hypothetical protein AL050_23225 [Pseudomonas syringae pv. daphniphylli]
MGILLKIQLPLSRHENLGARDLDRELIYLENPNARLDDLKMRLVGDGANLTIHPLDDYTVLLNVNMSRIHQ